MWLGFLPDCEAGKFPDGDNAYAERLVISLKTVQNHVANIYSKLQVANRVQAAIRAREAGLGGKGR